jgi:hypothetical protein
MGRLLTEKEENAIVFEDFPFVHNSAVFLRKLFVKNQTITIFWKEEENEKAVYYYDGQCFNVS